MARILLIENDTDQGEYFAHVLRSAGYEVDVAEDYRGGKGLYDRRRPDVVILDAQIPHEEGETELWRQLQSEPRLPVVLHTTHLGPTVSSFGLAGDDYVVKSADSTELTQAVARMLGRRVPPPRTQGALSTGLVRSKKLSQD